MSIEKHKPHKNNRLFGKKKNKEYYKFRLIREYEKPLVSTHTEDPLQYAMEDAPSVEPNLAWTIDGANRSPVLFEGPLAVTKPQVSSDPVEIAPTIKKNKSKSPKRVKTKTQDDKKTHPLAKWGFISSLLGVLTLPFILYPVILCPLGIFLSIWALKKIRNDPEQYKGKGLAKAGLIMGITAIALLLAFLITEFIGGWGSLSW